MNLYAMFDKKSGQYFGICLWKNDDLYKRSLHNIVNTPAPDNLLNSHPTDFELFCIGTFDERSGEIVSGVKFICSAADLKKED